MSILVSINDTCRLLSIGRTTVYSLIKSGQLGKVKIGRRTLVIRKTALALAGLSEKEGN